MTDAPACQAYPFDDLMLCDRCGLAWPAQGDKAPCEPVTYERMRAAALDALTSAERSLAMVMNLSLAGSPADPARARRRVAELGAIVKLLDRLTASPELKAAIAGKGRQHGQT